MIELNVSKLEAINGPKNWVEVHIYDQALIDDANAWIAQHVCAPPASLAEADPEVVQRWRDRKREYSLPYYKVSISSFQIGSSVRITCKHCDESTVQVRCEEY